MGVICFLGLTKITAEGSIPRKKLVPNGTAAHQISYIAESAFTMSPLASANSDNLAEKG